MRVVIEILARPESLAQVLCHRLLARKQVGLQRTQLDSQFLEKKLVKTLIIKIQMFFYILYGLFLLYDRISNLCKRNC